jgi:hypothetical protein
VFSLSRSTSFANSSTAFGTVFFGWSIDFFAGFRVALDEHQTGFL